MPKGELADYAADLGQAACVQLLQWRLEFVHPMDWHNVDLRGLSGYELVQETGCWLWRGRTLPEGYAQVKRKTLAQQSAGVTDRNAGKNFLFHRIAFVAKNGFDVHQGASHLCGRPQCFNPEHIVDENIQLNNRRKGCIGVVTCPDHGHLIVDLCEHTPRCIKPNPPNVNCCLSRRLPSLDGHASPVRSSSPPASDRRATADVQNFMGLDPSSLPGFDHLLSNTSGGASLADEFVMGDDVVEFETSV
jgi:hypothetical protein